MHQRCVRATVKTRVRRISNIKVIIRNLRFRDGLQDQLQIGVDVAACSGLRGPAWHVFQPAH